MKKSTKYLIISLIVIIFIKILLSTLVLSPSAFSDEYSLAKMARSFFYSQEFTIHEMPTQQYLPLYPVLLSISYLLKDMQLVYLFMKILNSIISSMILIPCFLLAKEFISKKKALMAAIIVSFYPSNFSFSPFIMAENLFYPLFLFSIYFIFKAFTEKEYKWSILSGIFIALTLLTKMSGIILISIVIILYLYALIKKEFNFKLALTMGISFIVVLLPWLLRNIILFGFSINKILGVYSDYLIEANFSFPSLLTWLIIYIGIFIVSTGFIYFLFNLIDFKIKEKNEKLIYFKLITLVSFIITVITAANASSHATHLYTSLFNWLVCRPIARTSDIIVPLILINGIINLKYITRIKKYIKYLLIIIFPILLVTTQLIFFPLFPVNNMSLVLLGIINYLINGLFKNPMIMTLIVLIMFIIILLGIYYILIKNKINFKRIVILTILFFLMTSILNYAIIAYNADKYWYEDEQIQFGIWFNQYDQGKSTVLIDDKYEGQILKIGQTSLYEKNRVNNTATKIGFFMNNKIIIGDIKNTTGVDYILTKQKLDLNLIKKTKGNILLYKAY